MATEVVSFISSKGGSGKTVTSFSIGQILASLGFKVLLIDADASTNGLTLLTLPGVTRAKSQSMGIAIGIFDSEDSAYISSPLELSENLDFLPATYHMANTEKFPVDKFREHLLRILGERFVAYDFIFIDAQAGVDPFAKAAVSVSGQSIIVSEYDPSSVQGIERLKVIFSDVLQPGSFWILFNKILPEFGRAIGEGLLVARYAPPIIWDAGVVRAVATRENPINIKNPNDYTLALAGTISSLFDPEVRARLASWLKTAQENITLPIKTKLDQVTLDLEKILLQQVEMRAQAESKKRRYSIFWGGSSLGVVGISVVLMKFFNEGALFLPALISLLVVLLGGFLVYPVFSDVTRSNRQTLEQELVSLKRADLERERERLIASVEVAEATLRLSDRYRASL